MCALGARALALVPRPLRFPSLASAIVHRVCTSLQCKHETSQQPPHMEAALRHDVVGQGFGEAGGSQRTGPHL